VRALNRLTVTTALATGLLCVGHPGAVAGTDTRGEPATTPSALTPITQLAPDITVLRVGAIKTDSLLEVDRSANAAKGADNNVGSDLEGGSED